MPVCEFRDGRYCEQCRTQLVGNGECLFCRAVTAETRLAELSVWGDDDWMRRLASLSLNREASGLVPIGLEMDMPSSLAMSAGPTRVVTRPQMTFRPEMLTVAPDCAYVGALVDAYVGNKSQFVAPGPIPLSVFSPTHWGSIEVMHAAAGRMRWDVANIAQDIALVIDFTLPSYEPLVETAIEAMGGTPRPTKFRAALWGRTAPEAQPTYNMHVPGMPQYGPPMPVPVTSADVDEARRTVQFAGFVNDIRQRPSSRR